TTRSSSTGNRPWSVGPSTWARAAPMPAWRSSIVPPESRSANASANAPRLGWDGWPTWRTSGAAVTGPIRRSTTRRSLRRAATGSTRRRRQWLGPAPAGPAARARLAALGAAGGGQDRLLEPDRSARPPGRPADRRDHRRRGGADRVRQRRGHRLLGRDRR